MHRGALAAANRARRRCGRPRGRRRRNSSSRLRQAELVGRSDAQGVCEAETSLAATGKHNNDGAVSPEMSKASGKIEQGEMAKTTAAQAIKGGQEARGSCAVAFTAPVRRQNGHDRAWNAEEGNAGNVASAVDTVHKNYRHAIRQNSQIFITTQKSPKTKVVQNLKFYNFSFITNP